MPRLFAKSEPNQPHRTIAWLRPDGTSLTIADWEAQEETLKMLEVYREFLEDYCAIPVITGEKSAYEKFPGTDIIFCV